MSEQGPLIHSFVCEQCLDSVVMTWHEYVKQQGLVQNTRRNPHLNGARILCSDCRMTEARRRGSLSAKGSKKTTRRDSEFPKKAQLNLRPNERDEYGVIATLREQGSDRVVTVAASGPVLQALAMICDMADARDGDWRVVTVCTPATIFADLQGWRNDSNPTPEATLLGKLQRRDLLEAKR